jgi:hypothetical protein
VADREVDVANVRCALSADPNRAINFTICQMSRKEHWAETINNDQNVEAPLPERSAKPP